MNTHEDEALIWGLEGRSSEFTVYDFSHVLEATDNFSEENKLGQGGFGPVYKVHKTKKLTKVIHIYYSLIYMEFYAIHSLLWPIIS
jgi:hypothetical protein